MNDQALVTTEAPRFTLTITAAAEEQKSAALEKSALIGRVSNADEQELAVAAQAQLKIILSNAEHARKAAKEPVLDAGRQIDATVKSFVADLQAEELRIARLIADFQALELAKVRAAEAARRLEEERIERERQAELKRLADEEKARQIQLAKAEAEARQKEREAKDAAAKAEAENLRREIERQKQLAAATSLEKMEAVQERFSQEAAALPVAKQATRTEGQRVSEEWEITVTDIHALYRAHPACCKVAPLLAEIKALLNMGVKVHGVNAQRVVKASVRPMKEPAAIEA